MVSVVIAFPLIMHGLANLAGVFAPWSKSLLGFSEASWIFPGNVTLRSAAGRAFSLVWFLSTVCLVGAGVGLILGQAGWLRLAISGCLVSLAAILPWWRAVPPGARFGAVFDVLVVVLLLSPLGGQVKVI